MTRTTSMSNSAASPIMGCSFAAQRLREVISYLAQIDVHVLILGPTGSGKGLVASELHRQSERQHGPFVATNIASLPATLFQSELAGSVRGAYTSARDRKGLFERADGGTLFLDEVGELEPDLQVNLLRLIETGFVERLGSDEIIRVDVRIVAATNCDLEARVAAGRFRADLFERLKGAVIQVSSLKERAEDIPALASHFVERILNKLEPGCSISIAPDAIEILQSLDWPGNIRSLEKTIEGVTRLAIKRREVKSIDLRFLIEALNMLNTVARPVYIQLR